jgi:hypothetical protein
VTAKIWGKFGRAVGGGRTSFLPKKGFSGSFSIVLGDALKRQVYTTLSLTVYINIGLYIFNSSN